MFQSLQEAYQCLSNDNERAWYDNHREQILKGKDTEDYHEDDSNYITKSNLQKYFNLPKSEFYSGYHNLFKTLDKEEE